MLLLLVLGVLYATGSLVLVCSVCAAAALSPSAPAGKAAPRPVPADADGRERVYSLTARR